MKQNRRNITVSIIVGLVLVGFTACTPPIASPTVQPTVAVLPTPTSEEAYPPPPSETPVEETPTTDVSEAYPPPADITNPSLTRLDMIDEQNGWGMSREAILVTRDGGSTWADVSPGDSVDQMSIAGGFFLDNQTAWIVVPDSQNPDIGTLYRTDNGGSNWESARVPFGNGGIDFIDEQTGFVMAARGAGAGSMAVDIYRTSDEGTTWEEVYRMEPGSSDPDEGLPFSGIKSGIGFSNPDNGWLTGSIPMDGNVYLYRTQDGGQTWGHQDLTLPAGFTSAQTATEPPVFFSELEGVLPVRLYLGDGAMAFYTTQDGGETWNWNPAPPPASIGAYSIASMQDFFVWDGGVLYNTHDAGLTWNPINPNIDLNQILALLDFVDADTGWAISWDAQNNFQLYKTDDGGTTWVEVSE